MPWIANGGYSCWYPISMTMCSVSSSLPEMPSDISTCYELGIGVWSHPCLLTFGPTLDNPLRQWCARLSISWPCTFQFQVQKRLASLLPLQGCFTRRLSLRQLLAFGMMIPSGASLLLAHAYWQPFGVIIKHFDLAKICMHCNIVQQEIVNYTVQTNTI